MVRVTCSSGYPSLSQPLVCLRWGFLIPLIALSLDGVFRGCFAVDFSHFLPFRWEFCPLVFSLVSLALLQRSLRFPPSSDIALYYPMVQSGRGKVSRCPLTPPSIATTVNLRSLRQFSREVILLVSPFFISC